jgi:hypothetical protein
MTCIHTLTKSQFTYYLLTLPIGFAHNWAIVDCLWSVDFFCFLRTGPAMAPSAIIQHPQSCIVIYLVHVYNIVYHLRSSFDLKLVMRFRLDQFLYEYWWKNTNERC